jgi:ribosomal protein L44E
VKITFTCHECGKETEVDYTPSIPAKINCRMEDSQPEQPFTFEPTFCHYCNTEFNSAEVDGQTQDKAESDRDDYWDNLRQFKKDESYERREANDVY